MNVYGQNRQRDEPLMSRSVWAQDHKSVDSHGCYNSMCPAKMTRDSSGFSSSIHTRSIHKQLAVELEIPVIESLDYQRNL